MADEQFTQADAEDAGWRIVHEGVNPEETEDASANSTYFRAERYYSPPGQTARLLEEVATTEDKLYERIAAREQWLGAASQGEALATVQLPKDPDEKADTHDPGSFVEVTEEEYSARSRNDVLTVLSDPEDPESDHEQVIFVGGVETDPEALSEPATPNSSTEADVLAGRDAAIESATESRDDGTSDADAASAASTADAETQQDALDSAEGGNLQGDPGDSGNDPEVTQPEAGEATDASDSEQQSQVNDSEAATSDAVSTNSTDPFPKTNASQPEELGPDTDAEAPAPAPNAGQGVTATGVPADAIGNAGEGEAPKSDNPDATDLARASDEGMPDAPEATPAAEKAAEEHGVDLATVEGTGKDGKVTKADVTEAAKVDDGGGDPV